MHEQIHEFPIYFLYHKVVGYLSPAIWMTNMGCLFMMNVKRGYILIGEGHVGSYWIQILVYFAFYDFVVLL